jgi:phosphatidylinositol 4-kinase
VLDNVKLLYYIFSQMDTHWFNHIQTLPAGFLLIASGLTSTKLRSDYRHRLLSLCSDVGLAAESKSGRYDSVVTFMLIACYDGVSCDFSF